MQVTGELKSSEGGKKNWEKNFDIGTNYRRVLAGSRSGGELPILVYIISLVGFNTF
jgi:hypothetical protein